MTKLTMNTTGTTKNRAFATTEAACATPKSNATAAVVITSKRPISTQPAIPFPRFLSFASEGGALPSPRPVPHLATQTSRLKYTIYEQTRYHKTKSYKLTVRANSYDDLT